MTGIGYPMHFGTALGTPEVDFHTDFLISQVKVLDTERNYTGTPETIAQININPSNMLFNHPSVSEALEDETTRDAVKTKLFEFRQAFLRGIERSGGKLGIKYKSRTREDDPIVRGVTLEFTTSAGYSIDKLKLIVKQAGEEAKNGSRDMRSMEDILAMQDSDTMAVQNVLKMYEQKGASRENT